MLELKDFTLRPNQQPPRITIDRTFDENMAYIFGVCLGDASVYHNSSNNYRVVLEVKDKEFADSFSEALESIGLKPHYRLNPSYGRGGTTRSYHLVYADSKDFYDYYSSITLGRLKQLLVEGGEKFIIAFLRGFFDSEGHYDGRYQCKMSNKDTDVIDLAFELIEAIGFDVSIHNENVEKKGVCEQLYILGSPDVKREFIDTIKPTILRKMYPGGEILT